MSFNYEIKGLKEIQTALEKSPEIARPIFQKAIEGTVAIFAKNTQKNNPVPWRTGALTQTFQFNPGPLRATWGPTRNYAIFVHEGTAPHVITARKGKVLVNKETGQFFGKVVHHPGTKANRFMPKIMTKAEKEINQLFAQALEMFTNKLTGKI